MSIKKIAIGVLGAILIGLGAYLLYLAGISIKLELTIYQGDSAGKLLVLIGLFLLDYASR
ncbi:hypothetical protein [Stygiolobus azoricus]|uniref:Uncharacterized protein n=1 Tax=Stygiolobus azoricus TaxID=41675 RepID=A0A650CPD1_9CREN|nr:hypothetical protein [Stygiolobus azoricus]QGR19706.1 hypothetical protein D1868_06655 [Stygiolobus azoricus]